jgi:TetR/AcrR family transcriptional regulator, regulator of mycofactocin system
LSDRSGSGPRTGRRPATTKDELTRIGLALFVERGFERTTVDDIAAEAGIGRRTFFRYFDSKNDLPWGDFDDHLEEMRRHLRRLGTERPLMEALRVAVVEFNRYPPEALALHRRRMHLLLTVPALQAHSTLRYRAWRDVIARYVAERRGLEPEDHEPKTIAWAMLGIALAAYETWLTCEDAELAELLDASLRSLSRGFAEP